MDRDSLKDRPRGILTEDDREFLLGEMDFSEYKHPEQTRRTRRQRIRTRVREGIIDFNLIRNLPEEDLTQLFMIADFDSVDELDEEDKLMLYGFREMFSVFFQIVIDNPMFAREIVSSAFQDAANEADPERHHTVIDFGLETEATPYSELIADFWDREELTYGQLYDLLTEGFISEDEMESYIQDLQE